MSRLALAGLSAKEALRSRLVVVMLLAMAAALAALAWGANGDGTPGGRVRAFLSWGWGFQALLVSLATVFLASGLGGALREGRLVVLLTGPLPRWQLLLSWWLGVSGVALGLTLAAHLLLGGLAFAMVSFAPEAGDRAAMREVLTARGVARPPPLDREALREEAAAAWRELQAQGRIPPGLTEELAVERLSQQLELRRRTAGPRRSLEWRLEGIHSGDGASLLLRFRYVVQASQGALPAGQGPEGMFHFLPEGGTWLSSPPVRWSSGDVHQLPLAPDMLQGASAVTIQYENLETRPVAVMFPEGELQVLYPAGGFAMNLVRGAAVQLGRLAFLAALGVALAALLEGRLAALVVLFVALVSTSHAFLEDALSPRLFGGADPAVKATLGLLLWALPDWARVDVAGLLSGAQAVELRGVAEACLGDGVLRGGSCLGLAALLFARRELGALR